MKKVVYRTSCVIRTIILGTILYILLYERLSIRGAYDYNFIQK